MGGGAWWVAVHGFAKSRSRLSDFTFTFHFHVLEKEMATHSSVLAWRIPGTREPGGLSSVGLHSQTRLKRLSSSISLLFLPLSFHFHSITVTEIVPIESVFCLCKNIVQGLMFPGMK